MKGGWGRYPDMRRINPDVIRMNPNAITYAIYRWSDPNGNRNYDPGEVNLDPNGPDFETFTATEFGAVPPKIVANPDEKQPTQDEFSVSLEQALMANFAVRLTGLYSRMWNVYRLLNTLRPYDAFNVPVTNRDPGPDGSAGTADDGGLVTYYEYAPALVGARFEELTPIADPNADQDYKSVEVAVVRRLANRWQFMGSYSATKKNRPYVFGGVGGFPSQAGNFDPNAEINTTDRTWDWDAKVMGTYIFPTDVSVSANFEHRSGDAFARTVQFRGGQTIRSIVLNVEPIGAQRLPNVNLMTLRVEKSFSLRNAHRLAVRLNLYNALNANTATSLQPRAGASYLRPRVILPPRLAEISASYTF
jgi:hypothetical protein